MALTEEQLERSRRNRERALEIQKRRKLMQEAEAEPTSPHASSTGNGNGGAGGDREAKRQKVNGGGGSRGDEKHDEQKSEEAELELEDFEVNASVHVSKKEAMQMYCLPEGTLAVCSFVEKANPRHKGWTPMKLYNRAEIRRRARARFGGLEGLVAERNKRAEKRFRKDLEATKDIFR